MIRRVAPLIAAALLLCGFTQPRYGGMATRQEASLIHHIEAIKHLHIWGDTLSARQYAEAALQNDSTYAPAHHMMAAIATKREQALAHAERAYLADSTNRFYASTYVEQLLNGQQYGRATAVLERLIRRSTDPNHYRILALLYASADRHAEAIAILDTAEMRFGRIPPLSRYRQHLLLVTRQPERAIADAEQQLAEAPYMPENHIALAEIYAALGRDSLSRHNYRRALQLDSTNTESLASWSDYLLRRRDYPAYLDVLARLFRDPNIALERKVSQLRTLTADITFYREHYARLNTLAATLHMLHPDNDQVEELYTRHLLASGKVEAAATLLKGSFRNNPDVTRLSDIIEVERYLNRADSVRHYLELGLKQWPTNTNILVLRGSLAAIDKRYTEAEEYYRRALKHADNDTLRSRIWGLMGDNRYHRGNRRGSHAAFERALRLDADNATALNNYAYFLAEEGQHLDRALTMAKRATTLAQSNPTFLDTLAWVLYKLGLYDQAKPYMQQAISLDRTNSAELALHYGDILAALGEEFMAKTYWRKALERGYDSHEIGQRIEALNNKKR